MSNPVLLKPFPTLVPNVESLELSCLVLVDEMPPTGSWFCARAFELAAGHGRLSVQRTQIRSAGVCTPGGRPRDGVQAD